MIGRILAVLGILVLFSATTYAAQDEFVQVEIKGTLHSERGGATISADGFRYQLDLSPRLEKQAQGLDNRQVMVSGNLFVREGKDGCPRIFVEARRIGEFRDGEVRYEREVVREPVERRVIVREKEHDPPVFKAGPLEIHD